MAGEMAAEPTSRFAHLLQPIRDLSKVWKIEIAEELGRYIEEVGHLCVTDPVDGISQLNFAEAALLIQGSTAIYSRKVELLHQLVYQALELLTIDKKDLGKKGKVAPNGFLSGLPDTDELLTIDHLIKEGRNILLDTSAPEQRQALQRRVPLFLMPRDAAERSQHEYRISSCTVHQTGAYLLQESDARLLDAVVDEGLTGVDAPLLPAPPREVQDLDDRLQELLREFPQESGPEELPFCEPPLLKSPAPRGIEAVLNGHTPTKLRTPVPPRGLALAGVDASKRGTLIPQDPWAALDDHDVVGHELPLVVGKTSKRINGKKLLLGAEDPADGEAFIGIADEELWDASLGDKAVTQLLAAGHPVESLFLAAAGHAKVGGRFEAQRAGFSAAWLEFEDLFCRAAAKRRGQKAFPRRPEAPGTPHASDDEGGGAAVVAAPPVPDMSQTPVASALRRGDVDLGLTPLPDFAGDSLCMHDERREEVARLENMIEDAQSRYEATVREHLHSTNKDAADGSDERFTQLYANVRRWQDQLVPVLKEFESRPEFDIDEYSTRFLDTMVSVPASRGAEDEDGAKLQTMKFARLVHGQPRWEICRRFLTCLILTNNGNTDIVMDAEDGRANDFSIKLLKAEKRMVSIEGTEAPAAARKKSKAAPPLQDAPPAKQKKLRRA